MRQESIFIFRSIARVSKSDNFKSKTQNIALRDHLIIYEYKNKKIIMVVKHCCYGLCTSDSRYPEKLPEGTKFYFKFYPFTKPGYIKETMTNWEKEKQNQRTEKARRWLKACGRKDFNSIEQITKHTYICSLHFIDPIEENPDPVHATSMTERVGKRKRPKERLQLPSKKKQREKMKI